MFQERPFRQQKQSTWSIWWFVGFMAIGLTLWHLEIIPQSTTPTPAELSLIDEALDPHPLLNAPPPHSTLLQTPADGEIPELQPVNQTRSTSASTIQLASHEETVSPVVYSGNEVPVQTLTYRPDLQPVKIQQIPAATGAPPVQNAGYQEIPNSPGQSPVVTAMIPQQTEPNQLQLQNSEPVSAAEVSQPSPLELSQEAEADILQLRELSRRYWKQEELRLTVDPRMQELAQKIYFLPDTHYLASYSVQPGDQLRLIAQQHQVSWQYLARLNRIEPEKIRPGQTLKMMKGPFHAVVDLSDRTLTVHAHGYYMASFPVGTGKDDATPTGEFPVINKVENPTYYGPDGIIGADDPRNPLGEHWIDLGNSYGIHGTTDPNSIGHSFSKGCIRMHSDDVALVYDLLTLDSLVIIRP